MSGGGEWGAKASLLSLDPQTTYGVQSEDDELDRFQRSFHGENTADGATVRPGDYVQFFVEKDPEDLQAAFGHMKVLRTTQTSLPIAAFGVGEFRKYESGPETGDASSAGGLRLAVQLAPHHFGAFSAEGLYLEMSGGEGKEKASRTTKLNTPGTIIHPMPLITGRVKVHPPRLSRRELTNGQQDEHNSVSRKLDVT